MTILNSFSNPTQLEDVRTVSIFPVRTSLESSIKASGRVIIPVPGGYQCCLPEEFIYLKALSNYTEIYYQNGTKKLISKTLKSITSGLPPNRFFRVHKSYVVNTAHITDIMLSSVNSSLKLEGGFNIPISREKKVLFCKLHPISNNLQ